jgi:hypothetical protein
MGRGEDWLAAKARWRRDRQRAEAAAEEEAAWQSHIEKEARDRRLEEALEGRCRGPGYPREMVQVFGPPPEHAG